MANCDNFRSLVTHLSRIDTGQPLFIDADTGHHVTSRQFANAVWRRAASLQGLGVKRGDKVAVLAVNSTDTFGTLCAIIILGAVAVPLNLRWTELEQAFALSDAGVDIVLCDVVCQAAGEKLRAATDRQIQLVPMNEVDGMAGGAVGAGVQDAQWLDSIAATDADDDCVILYTGGTTGRSKGAVHSHRSLLSGARTMALSGFPMPGRTFACCFPLFHIAGLLPSVARLFQQSPTLFLTGFDAAKVAQSVREWNVGELGLAPTMIQLLITWEGFQATDFSGLQRILYGSSPIAPSLLSAVREALPKVGLAQAYGMTEAGVFAFLNSALHDLTPRYDAAAGQVLCPDVIVRIEGEDGRPVQLGERGEVVVYAESLLTRYQNLPDATLSVLRNGGYRTGDIGDLDDAGVLTIRDRLKDMIITGGENVYSIEVEAAISLHAAVVKAAVIGVPHPIWGEAVHAVVVVRDGSRLTFEGNR